MWEALMPKPQSKTYFQIRAKERARENHNIAGTSFEARAEQCLQIICDFPDISAKQIAAIMGFRSHYIDRLLTSLREQNKVRTIRRKEQLNNTHHWRKYYFPNL